MATAAVPSETQSESSSQPDSIPVLDHLPAAPSQGDRLEDLIPAGATSTEKLFVTVGKRELFADSDAVFSGRCDSAAVRCLLATLEESDLRGLREQLRDSLTMAIPTTAGRPLRIRQSGNVCALADDCWELVYSATQVQLTRRADTNVLKPAGRTPLPPPGSSTAPPPGLVSAATVETSLRSVIETQLRMESELEDLRRRATAAETQRSRLQRLEERTSELQEACAACDAKIAHLEDLLRSAVDQQTASRPGGGDSTADKASPMCSPVDSNGDVETSVKSRSASARDIAAAIDVRALGKVIADVIQWRVGDSDSESDCDSGEHRDGRRGAGAPGSTARREPKQQRAPRIHRPAAASAAWSAREPLLPRIASPLLGMSP